MTATTPAHTALPRGAGLLRAGLTGAAVSGVLFLACWLGTSIEGLSVTHAFISLFTTEPVTSQAALAEGGVWAVVFGAFAGALIAFFHGLFAGRR